MASMIFVVWMLGGRALWQYRPSLGSCWLFWMGVFTSSFHNYLVGSLPTACLVLGDIGAACNCLVTIANDGKMPVMGRTGSFVSVWRKARKHDKFLFLCDRYAGCSIGDFFLFSSVLLSFVYFTFFGWRG